MNAGTESGDLFDPAADAVADVLVPVAVDTAYSYRIPKGLVLAPGDFVEVPLGNREATGVVWGVRNAPGGNLKSIIAKRDLPTLRQPLRDFVDWVARWTLSPRGMVLRMGTRAPESAGPEPVRVGVRLAATPPHNMRMTPARARALKAAEGGLCFSKSALAQSAACTASVIDGLVDEGALEAVTLPPEAVALAPDLGFITPVFEPDQAMAAQQLRGAVTGGVYSCTLLEGVTGSGKTEVYFEAVAAAIESGRQALILMPEIALTGQFLDRFAKRFGVRPAEWHSGVSSRKRARIWAGVASGDVKEIGRAHV